MKSWNSIPFLGPIVALASSTSVLRAAAQNQATDPCRTAQVSGFWHEYPIWGSNRNEPGDEILVIWAVNNVKSTELRVGDEGEWEEVDQVGSHRTIVHEDTRIWLCATNKEAFHFETPMTVDVKEVPSFRSDNFATPAYKDIAEGESIKLRWEPVQANYVVIEEKLGEHFTWHTPANDYGQMERHPADGEATFSPNKTPTDKVVAVGRFEGRLIGRSMSVPVRVEETESLRINGTA